MSVRAFPSVLIPVVLALAALALAVALPAAEPAPATEPTVPPEVLAEAARIADHAKAPVPPAVDPPSEGTLAAADDIDAQLGACRVLLDGHDTVKAGECFVTAVNRIGLLSPAERKSLGARYLLQRRRLGELAERLLADPAIAAALDARDPADLASAPATAAALTAPATPAVEVPAAP